MSAPREPNAKRATRCPDCVIRPGGAIRTTDGRHCARCGENVLVPVVLVAGPLRDDRAPTKAWRPGDRA